MPSSSTNSYTDTALLDALEAQGWGIGVVHDDDKHWYVLTDGTQDVVVDGPFPFFTTHIADEEDCKWARPTIREAISAWIERCRIEDEGE